MAKNKKPKSNQYTLSISSFIQTIKTAEFLKTTLIVIVIGFAFYLVNSGIYTYGNPELLRSPRVMGLIEVPILWAILGLLTVILYTHQRDLIKK